MKVLIAADMEGISGVTCWDHVTPSHKEYDRFRKIMTADVNAAVKGTFQGGADEVVVTDGHNNGRNILLEELDVRAKLNSGLRSPLAMVQGVDEHVNAVMLVGYHARHGSQNAILDHTWTTGVSNLWLNGKLSGEIGLNSAVCAHYNVPVIMVAGDQTACAEAADLLLGVEVAVVKHAHGHMSAECLPLDISHQRIREAAARAINNLRADMAPLPYRLEPPILLVIEFINSDMTDKAARLPGACRLDAVRVQITADDMPSAYQSFRAAATLASA